MFSKDNFNKYDIVSLMYFDVFEHVSSILQPVKHPVDPTRDGMKCVKVIQNMFWSLKKSKTHREVQNSMDFGWGLHKNQRDMETNGCHTKLL